MKHSFDGFDYLELSDKWCIYVPFECDDDGSWIVEFAMNFLFKMRWDDNDRRHKYTRVSQAFIDDCRAFVSALAEWDQSEKPLWEGLSKIESDENFVRMFIPLLPYAWV